MSPSDAVADRAWRVKDGIFREARLASLGLPHGVTTRSLGDMKDPERRARALDLSGLAVRLARVLTQVHGATVLEARSEDASVPQGDGWIVKDPDVVACVYAADCLPIFIWEKMGAEAGVFHAGWR